MLNMLSPFACGTFHPEEEHDEVGAIGSDPNSPSSTPRRSFARKASLCKTNNSKNKNNPYSTRGLDKFEALLTELEEKKKEIYTRNDPNDISFIRFAYKSPNDCVPIVVKLKDKSSPSRSPPRAEAELIKDKHVAKNTESSQQSAAVKHIDTEPKAMETDKKSRSKKNSSMSWRSLSLEKWRRPSFYMPAAIILILVCLLFFGRSVAIMCTSIGWYLVPTLSSSSGSERSTKFGKKKELVRRSSENKMMVTQQHRSPERLSPRQHGHRRSY